MSNLYVIVNQYQFDGWQSNSTWSSSPKRDGFGCACVSTVVKSFSSSCNPICGCIGWITQESGVEKGTGKGAGSGCHWSWQSGGRRVISLCPGLQCQQSLTYHQSFLVDIASYIGCCRLCVCQSLPPCLSITDSMGQYCGCWGPQPTLHITIFPCISLSGFALWFQLWEMSKKGVGMHTSTTLVCCGAKLLRVTSLRCCYLFHRIKNVKN